MTVGAGPLSEAAACAVGFRGFGFYPRSGFIHVDCPIKGNVSGEGERIYHTPWSTWYGRTKIDEADGERWFCDEAEAIAAGWRAARFR